MLGNKGTSIVQQYGNQTRTQDLHGKFSRVEEENFLISNNGGLQIIVQNIRTDFSRGLLIYLQL